MIQSSVKVVEGKLQAVILQKLITLVDTGLTFEHSLSFVLQSREVAFLAQNSNRTDKYGAGNDFSQAFEALNGENDGSTYPALEALKALDVFSEYDIRVIENSLFSGSLTNSLKRLFEEHVFFYNL